MKKKILIPLASAALLIPTYNASASFDVAAAWVKDCSKCHAEDGSGLTKKGRKLRIKDYRDAEVQAKMTDEEIIKAIKEGVLKDGEELMNPYAESYSEEEIQAFLAYVRGFKKT